MIAMEKRYIYTYEYRYEGICQLNKNNNHLLLYLKVWKLKLSVIGTKV
jgi:hypothetical protein